MADMGAQKDYPPRLPYGNGYLQMPPLNLELLEGGDPEPLSDDEARSRCEEALSGLEPGEKTVILIPDGTRSWSRSDLFVPIIVNSLKGDLKIIVATGMHRGATAQELPGLVGDVFGKVRVENHDSRDEKNLSYIGETSHGTPLFFNRECLTADRLIIFSGVTHHLIAGFGGGRKMILPGISGFDTIQKNHYLALSNHDLSLCGNPVNEDMVEGALSFLVGKTSMAINVGVNSRGAIYCITAGDWYESWSECCREVKRAEEIQIDEKADYALVSAGGWGRDGQLYQSVKALFNTAECVKRGGSIVFAAQCMEGVGPGEFEESLLHGKMGEKFSMPSYVALRLRRILGEYRIILISDLPKEATESMGFEYAKDLRSAILGLSGRGYIIPSGGSLFITEGDVR